MWLAECRVLCAWFVDDKYRVTLPLLEGPDGPIPGSDYINASFVKVRDAFTLSYSLTSNGLWLAHSVSTKLPSGQTL